MCSRYIDTVTKQGGKIEIGGKRIGNKGSVCKPAQKEKVKKLRRKEEEGKEKKLTTCTRHLKNKNKNKRKTMRRKKRRGSEERKILSLFYAFLRSPKREAIVWASFIFY